MSSETRLAPSAMTVSHGGRNKGRCSSSGCEDDGRERTETTPRRIHGTAGSGIAGMERRMVRRGGRAGTLAEALHAACCGAALRQTSMKRETGGPKFFPIWSTEGPKTIYKVGQLLPANI